MSHDQPESGVRPAAHSWAAIAYPQGVVDIFAITLTLGGVGWALDVYGRIGLQIYDQQFLAVMIGISLALSFLKFPASGPKTRVALPLYDVVLAALGFGAAFYIAWFYPTIVDMIYARPTDAVVAGMILLLLLVEALRRATGIALVILVVVFVCFALFADQLPDRISGRSSDWQKLAVYLAADSNGVLGLPVKVACTIVIAFVLFGQVLAATGGMRFFTDLAMAAMGRFRGGSAKIAVLGSCLFGSISGSAVANVVATGIVTIPLMKRAGYPAHKAGAIEAVASTGGQLMPPVMGAAAFLMAEFLQISYAEVVLAALIPGALYYIALFIQADLEAAKEGIPPVEPGSIPTARKVLREGWYFPLPFFVLIGALFWLNLEPETAVMWAILGAILPALFFGFQGKRITVRDLIEALRETGHGVVDLLLITAAAGIVIGVLAITGLGFQLTLLLVQIGQGNLGLLLFLSAIVCIILGMGLPTVGVYVLLATLVAPSLIKIGVEPIAAHLYVMYFGMMSMITPPIAIAAFAAASLAGADPMRTGFAATRFGWSAFIVPVLFVFSPSLLFMGSAVSIIIACLTATLGVWLISIAVVGHFQRSLNVFMRLLFGFAGLAALIPADAFVGAYLTDIFGALAGALLLGYEYLIAARKRHLVAAGGGDRA